MCKCPSFLGYVRVLIAIRTQFFSADVLCISSLKTIVELFSYIPTNLLCIFSAVSGVAYPLITVLRLVGASKLYSQIVGKDRDMKHRCY
jgi:hypothetical protein